jgi:hypothetical protein
MWLRSPSCGRDQNVEPRSYRALTGRNAFSNCFQAVNCQGYVHRVPPGQSASCPLWSSEMEDNWATRTFNIGHLGPGNCLHLFPELCIVRRLTLRLVKALELNSTERSHLMKLAKEILAEFIKRQTIPDELKELINYPSTPAYIIGARYKVLCGDRAADDLFSGFESIPITPGVSWSPAFCRALHSVGVAPSHTRNARRKELGFS